MDLNKYDYMQKLISPILYGKRKVESEGQRAEGKHLKRVRHCEHRWRSEEAVPSAAEFLRKVVGEILSLARSSSRLVSCASDFFGLSAIYFDHRAGHLAPFRSPARAVGDRGAIELLSLAGGLSLHGRKIGDLLW